VAEPEDREPCSRGLGALCQTFLARLLAVAVLRINWLCKHATEKGGGGWGWWLGRGQGVYLHCVFALRRLSRRLGRDRAREGVIQVLTADLSHRGITNDESLRVASLIIYTVWNIWMQLREAACSVGWPCDLMYLHFSMLGLL
jgi:hypothetical protein